MSENNENIEMFTDDEGNEVKFEHLDTLEIEDRVFVVCVPVPEGEEEIEEVIIFEAIKDDEDEDCFLQVEDESILETVYDAFKERNSEYFDFED